MQTEKMNQTIQLSDGRTLGYAAFGDEHGEPVFYFTGGNSSRFEGEWFEQAATKKKIRLIVPDRPGFGISTFQPNRQLLDWPNDVLALANALSIDSFSIFGLSGGGPHVLATLYQMPQRIKKAAVISGTASPDMADKFKGMWPPVKLIFATAKSMPFINRFLLKQMASFYSNEEQMLKRMKQALPLPDVELIDQNPDIIRIFAKASKESHRNGIEGDAWEWHLYVNDWGFKVSDIQREIRLWYGRYDQQVPIGMGRYFAQVLPNASLIEVENGGHFSTINNYIEDIFDYLTSK
ncbi:MAG: alpha/beta hydrolase [Anaerolineaceae bacterium]|nr:alpha/beta hydrolase [Anaerolineaceae bacterium]